MSQRGGVVSSHVRFGPKVYSPLIPNGTANVVLAFEAAEGLRWCGQVAANGMLAMNTQQLVPPIAFTKEFNYPEDPVGQAKKHVKRVVPVDAIALANEVGNPKLVNTVLLGAISGELPISDEIWEAVIRKRVPKGTEEANLKAFNKGKEAAR